jgi:hypothetical protein
MVCIPEVAMARLDAGYERYLVLEGVIGATWAPSTSTASC